MSEAARIISRLPVSDRIIVEAGTPFIKRYGASGIRSVRTWLAQRFVGTDIRPYVVADMKTMDRGATEVDIAADAGASAVVALGHAPVETLNAFIDRCEERQVDAMIDMMNFEFPLSVLRKLRRPPQVVILHRGVDEENFNKQAMLPLHEIRRIKGGYDIFIAVAGGDSVREVQSAIFNDTDIAVIWRQVFHDSEDTVDIVQGFLKQMK